MRRISKWGIKKEHFPEIWIAALCHDLLEDTPVTWELLASTTDVTSATYVQQLTFRSRNTDEPPKEYQEAKSAHLADFVHKPVEVLVIKIADRLENVEDFLTSKPEYAYKYFRRANGLWDALYNGYSNIRDRFGVSVLRAILEDQDFVQKRSQRQCAQ
jgi:(p)ppGpp synthase/HD superfamily hydrolase